MTIGRIRDYLKAFKGLPSRKVPFQAHAIAWLIEQLENGTPIGDLPECPPDAPWVTNPRPDINPRARELQLRKQEQAEQSEKARREAIEREAAEAASEYIEPASLNDEVRALFEEQANNETGDETGGDLSWMS